MSTEVIDGIKAVTTAFGEFKSDVLSRVEVLEARADRPHVASTTGATRDEIEHKERFLKWMRDPRGRVVNAELAEAESEISKKAVTIGTPSAGGYAVPAEIERQIERRVNQQNPWRQLVKVVTVGSSSYTHLVSKNAAGVGWVGEGSERTETATSELIQCVPTFGTIYARPKASEESVGDLFFDVGQWLIDEVSDAFSAEEANVIWSGSGSNRPSGIKNTHPSASDDRTSPERAATALEYIPMGSYTSPASITIDALIDLAYAVREKYLQPAEGVAWVMRRSTAATLRKLKDAQNQYLWQPSTIAGQPDSLLGYPVYLTDSVDAATSNLFPVAFGAWRRAYLFAIRQGLQITVDDNITTPGQVLWYVRRRVGGKVLNGEAAKLLKYSVS